MDLTKDALQFIQSTNLPARVADGPRDWTDKKLIPITPDLPLAFTAVTLSGFLGLIAASVLGFDPASVVIQILSFNAVSLIAKKADDWNRVQTFIAAKPPEILAFPFSQWLDHETFVIALQSRFVSTPDLELLLKLASNLTENAVKISLDDGISQELSVKRGVALKGTEIAKARVLLAPYRTFTEIQQPQSEFIFRARGGDEDAPPSLALFEADGGSWKLDAMVEIAAWFSDKTAIPVIY